MRDWTREGAYESMAVRVVLQSRSDRNRYWNLEKFERVRENYSFVRADRNSVVLFYHNDYGFGDYVKLFFDTGSKRLLRRIAFSDTGFSQVSDSQALQVLRISAELFVDLKAAPERLPEGLFSIPQSTYNEFARARPDRVRDGYTRDATNIQEEVGAIAISGNGVWFGKTFPDGEGYTGVGDIGFFDRQTNRYTFLHLPQLVAASISNLLLEGDVLWASLVGHPEGADVSGGLFRYDLKSRTTKVYPVGDVILRMARWRDSLYMMTSNGLYVLKGERLTRHRVEPDINGKPTIYSDQVQ